MPRILSASLVAILVWTAGVCAEEPEPKATVARAIKARGLKDDKPTNVKVVDKLDAKLFEKP